MKSQAIDQSTPGLDTSIFDDIIDNGTADQRLLLAAQLAEFIAAQDTAEAEREQVVPVVMKLTADPVSEVRYLLADGLAGAKKLNADIIFSIISDDDDIALPFLSATPALNHWHMLAVLRVGDIPRQRCIALRTDLSAEARAYIIKSSPIETCLALFDNPSVQFTDTEYQALFDRFGQSAEMMECLLACSDLPLDIRIVQAKRTSNRMHQMMAEKGWIPANDATELVTDAEETAVLRILVEASDTELSRVVEFLIGKGMLTPSIIVRAACLGEMHVLEHALAQLADIPVAKAKSLMAGKGLTGFKGLHAKSGLPQSCYGILQAACDTARDEQEEGITLDAEGFGRRLIEALMTRYEWMQLKERTKHLELIGRFAEDRVRIIARRLKADLVRAA